MDFFDKLSGIAKNLGSKANEVVESTKLNAKISNEKSKLEDQYKKIGEYYVDKYKGKSDDIDEEIREAFEEIDKSNGLIKEYEAQIEEQKAEGPESIFVVDEDGNEKKIEETKDAEAKKEEEKVTCPVCGAKNDPSNVYCYNCGTRLKPEEEKVAVAETTTEVEAESSTME